MPYPKRPRSVLTNRDHRDDIALALELDELDMIPLTVEDGPSVKRAKTFSPPIGPVDLTTSSQPRSTLKAPQASFQQHNAFVPRSAAASTSPAGPSSAQANRMFTPPTPPRKSPYRPPTPARTFPFSQQTHAKQDSQPATPRQAYHRCHPVPTFSSNCISPKTHSSLDRLNTLQALPHMQPSGEPSGTSPAAAPSKLNNATSTPQSTSNVNTAISTPQANDKQQSTSAENILGQIAVLTGQVPQADDDALKKENQNLKAELINTHDQLMAALIRAADAERQDQPLKDAEAKIDELKREVIEQQGTIDSQASALQEVGECVKDLEGIRDRESGVLRRAKSAIAKGQGKK